MLTTISNPYPPRKRRRLLTPGQIKLIEYFCPTDVHTHMQDLQRIRIWGYAYIMQGEAQPAEGEALNSILVLEEILRDIGMDAIILHQDHQE